MIYLISGASRAGKSILTRKLATSTGAGWFSIDAVREANSRLSEPDRLRHLWPLLRGIIADHVYYRLPYIFDGGDLSTDQIAEVLTAHGGQVRACVLGYPDIAPDLKFAQIRSSHGTPNDWLENESDDFVRAWVGEMIGESQALRAECDRHGIPFLNTGAGDFEIVIQEAADRLARP